MHYIYGAYVDEKTPQISITDLGFLRGYGIFEYLRTYRKKPFHLKDHLTRLFHSAEMFELKVPHSREEIEHVVNHLLKKVPYEETALRLIVTGGESEQGALLQDSSPTFAVLTSPLPQYNQSLYSEGIHVATTTLERSFPSVKTLYYAPAIVAMRRSPWKDIKEVLYLDSQKHILEASTSNFFAVKNGTILTAPSSANILPGITRKVVLQLAHTMFPVEERLFSLNELFTCEECFITSSTREVMPVVRIDGTRIGKGAPGEVSKNISKIFNSHVNKWAHSEV